MARPGNKNFPIWLILLGGVLVVAAALALLLRPQPQAPPAAQPTDSADVPAAGEPPRATLEEAKAAYDSGEAVFVDVRGPAGYEAGHIPGALLIPVNEFEAHLDELDKKDWILLYCT